MNGVRCPCGAKLLESLNGAAVVWCRHCKRYLLLSGTSGVQVIDKPVIRV